MAKEAIGFGRRGEVAEERKGPISRPIGFARKGELSLSDQISRIIDMGGAPEETICLVAEKLADAFYEKTALGILLISDEYRALGEEIKKIKNMKKFRELIKDTKKWAEEEEEASEELAKVYKSIGFCEYIRGRKKDGVKYMSLGIMALLSLDKVEEALSEIKIVKSLASYESYEKAERILKTLFKEMVDSQHPLAIIEAADALADFYKQNEMYKEAADAFGSILLIYQTNLENRDIAEVYTNRVLPEFIELKKIAGENVIPSILVAFDDMYHVAARNSEIIYLERLREIIKVLVNEMDGETSEETEEILERFKNYVELFEMRKTQYKISEKEFYIDGIRNFLKEIRKTRQQFE
ncbi:MAG: hypothetical protein QXL47_03315 [Candidatus Anstonellales archaeon]